MIDLTRFVAPAAVTLTMKKRWLGERNDEFTLGSLGRRTASDCPNVVRQKDLDHMIALVSPPSGHAKVQIYATQKRRSIFFPDFREQTVRYLIVLAR
jgi:hypothetical protein